MKNLEILKKALEKAVKNCYKIPILEKEVLIWPINENYGKNNSITLWTNGWIMSHDFAKAFCKKGTPYFIPNGIISKRMVYWRENSWKRFLQQMVISEDPITYLSKFL